MKVGPRRGVLLVKIERRGKQAHTEQTRDGMGTRSGDTMPQYIYLSVSIYAYVCIYLHVLWYAVGHGRGDCEGRLHLSSISRRGRYCAPEVISDDKDSVGQDGLRGFRLRLAISVGGGSMTVGGPGERSAFCG